MGTKLKWLKVKNKILLLVFILVFVIKELNAQQATWIWYPGDYEIWLVRRTDPTSDDWVPAGAREMVEVDARAWHNTVKLQLPR